MRYQLLPAVFAIVQPIVAWGEVGHRTVGYLAEKFLTQEAKSLFIDHLLKNDRNYDISDAAIWADTTARDAIKESAPWHYISEETPGYHAVKKNPCVAKKEF
jgi:hypothetical protein